MSNPFSISHLVFILAIYTTGYLFGASTADRDAVAWLKDWQTLLAGLVALFGAIVGAYAIFRQISQAAALAVEQRRRRLEAVRAALPLTLAEVIDYAEQDARKIKSLLENCEDNFLDVGKVVCKSGTPLPASFVKAFQEIIEFGVDGEATFARKLFSLMQVQHSRIRGMFDAIHDPLQAHMTTENELKTYAVDTAEVYAEGSAVFEYARFETESVREISIDDVASALRILRLNQYDFDRQLQSLCRKRNFPDRAAT